MKKHTQSLMGNLRNSFIAGIAIILPIWGVIFVMNFIVRIVNESLLSPIMNLIGPYISWADPKYVTLTVKGAILIFIVVLIALLGMMIKNFFIRRILEWGEGIILKIPLINKVYTAIQQISQTFLGTKKRAMFSRSVLVEYPRKGVYVLGLLTSEAAGEIQDKTQACLISVFVPTTPNPTSGFLLFVAKDDIISLDMSIEDSFKLIVSFGGVVPPYPVVPKSQGARLDGV